MKFGVYIHTHDAVADVNGIAELGAAAARHGWDGFFIWDELHHEGPVVDTQITLGAIAHATKETSLQIGALVTPLARRRPWKVAKELASLDQAAPGRVICGAGIGDDSDFELASSEPVNLKERALIFEDHLAILKVLLGGAASWERSARNAEILGDGETTRPLRIDAPSPFEPIPGRIPIWGSAVVLRTNDARQPKRPFMRAAREMDGLFPIVFDDDFTPDACLTPDELRQSVEWAEQGLDGPLPDGFDLVASGRTRMANSQVDLPGLTAAGLTWWLESMPIPVTLEAARDLIEKGPPRPE